MPAQTNNTDILSALNQTIAALNNIIPPLNSIARAITSRPCCGSGGASCGTTTDDPSDQQDDGQTPPAGFPDYQSYRSYKCDAANWIFDSFVETFTELNNAPFKWALNAPMPILIALAFGVLSSLATGIGTIILAILGALSALVLAIISSTLDFQDILDWLQANRQDIICALYNASDAIAARDAIKSMYTGAFANEAVFDAVASLVSIYNVLFEESNDVVAYADTHNQDFLPCNCAPLLNYYIAPSTYEPAYNCTITLLSADAQTATFRIVSDPAGGGSYLLFDTQTNQPISAMHAISTATVESFTYCSFYGNFYEFNDTFSAASHPHHDYAPDDTAMDIYFSTALPALTGWASDCTFSVVITITHPPGYGLA